MTAPNGLVIVDKPSGPTSHDVVARIRRLAGTRRVGHAGTLDPMATGVLVVGVEQATRLLGYLSAAEKEYRATIRLGETTDTDDAAGSLVSRMGAAAVSDAAVDAAVAALTGRIQQVPPNVSAIKVAGSRAYQLSRRGAPPRLAARSVTVRAFVISGRRRHADLLDIDATVTCSSGTYIRALARDLGAAVGVGGHLTALRRTSVGDYRVEQAVTLDALAESFAVTPLAQAAAAAFPRWDVSDEQAGRLAHGGRLPAAGLGPGTAAAFGPDGSFLALVREEDGHARPVAVFAS